MNIRPARADDEDAIRAFATDTFSWGDYVGDAFTRWVEADEPGLLVAVGADDVPCGLVRASMLSATEGWLQAIRVDPRQRRHGIGRLLTDAAIDWCGDQGASVVRLYAEADNEASHATAEATGFRATSSWVVAQRPVGEASPMPAGNGGRRVTAAEQLQRAHSSEAAPAFMSWESGELYRAARGLHAIGWTWRRLVPDDLTTAGKAEQLWNARSGWAMAARNDTTLSVGWVETSPGDAYDFCRALVDLASGIGAERLQAKLPAVPWLTSAARRAGCTLHPGAVFERGI